MTTIIIIFTFKPMIYFRSLSLQLISIFIEFYQTTLTIYLIFVL